MTAVAAGAARCPTCGSIEPDLDCPACLVYLAAEHHAHRYPWRPPAGPTANDGPAEGGEGR
jgi:hypothetical protein